MNLSEKPQSAEPTATLSEIIDEEWQAREEHMKKHDHLVNVSSPSDKQGKS